MRSPLPLLMCALLAFLGRAPLAAASSTWGKALAGVNFQLLASANLVVIAQPSNITYLSGLLRPTKVAVSAQLSVSESTDLYFALAKVPDVTIATRAAALQTFVAAQMLAASMTGTAAVLLADLVTWAAPIVTWYESVFFPSTLSLALGALGSARRAYRTQLLAIRAVMVIKQATNANFSLELNHLSAIDPYDFFPNFTGFIHGNLPTGSPVSTLAPTTMSPTTTLKTSQPTSSPTAPPTSFDWRNHGAVTPVGNQGSCGCCWAWSSGAVLEGRYAAKGGALVALSQQQVTSCTTQSNGCGGGDPRAGWQYSESSGGAVATASTYPYASFESSSSSSATPQCNTTLAANGVIQASGSLLQVSTEQDLMSALLSGGPISIAVEAGQPCFQNYAGGVITASPSCVGDDVDHAITIVGYGVDANAGPYWTAKNSWGTSWGEQGYVRIQRGVGSPGTIGMLTYATYPQSASASPACTGKSPPNYCAGLIPSSTSSPASSPSSAAVAHTVTLWSCLLLALWMAQG